MITSILVLCIGNICRSPLAEAYLKQELQKHGSQIKVSSAGLHAMHGYPAHENSTAIAIKEGFSLENHKAQQVSQHLLQQAELVLVMTNNQLKEVLQQFPESRGKVFLVRNNPPLDIADPYQKSQPAYLEAWELIQKGIDDWVKVLLKN
jgi:protein-tyrosine phosphatase